LATSGTQQVGVVGDRASLWSGTAESWTDLGAFAPAYFEETVASGIWGDGTMTYISGSGLNLLTNREEALLWTNATPGDANNDGLVDISDLGILATNWQAHGAWTAGDFNADGFIDITDLGLLATNWQAGVSAAADWARFGGAPLWTSSIPEPATGALVMLAARLVAMCSRECHRRRSGARRRR
jgi:hypothetical protein